MQSAKNSMRMRPARRLTLTFAQKASRSGSMGSRRITKVTSICADRSHDRRTHAFFYRGGGRQTELLLVWRLEFRHRRPCRAGFSSSGCGVHAQFESPPRCLRPCRGRGRRRHRRRLSSAFHRHIEAETTAPGRAGIVPVNAGQAWITGTHQHMLDPTNPYPGGYRLSDTWPMSPRS